ncbi:hypothetical protein COLO4_22770 [Corchorus olitorius]|uniref:Uncharacterized protein n=1 Tax=Corchorus olitorius TaxID=93759 RepID=A0A1R3IK13_9ROSI|nr:hypothetical protein COLO4_22770 [Corchorus olitorius]
MGLKFRDLLPSAPLYPDLLLVFQKPNPKASDLAGTEASSAVPDLFVPPSNHSDFQERTKSSIENGMGRFKKR